MVSSTPGNVSHANIIATEVQDRDLKLFFAKVRNHFAANVTGITRDETIAQNLMRVLFCKLHTEVNQTINASFPFLATLEDSAIANQVHELFERVKKDNKDIFDPSERIEIGVKDLAWIIREMQLLDIHTSKRDVIGEAFEELIGTAFRGGEGQFFTPRNVVEMMIEVLDPQSDESIIDPACGSGGFLASTSIHLEAKNALGYRIVGIDKDEFLARTARTYLRFLEPENSVVLCANSLGFLEENEACLSEGIAYESFDVVITNPPFGAKIPVSGTDLLAQYELGHEWKHHGEAWSRTTELHEKQPPQILFIERCLQLLKEGGRLGIVLPDGIFGNPSDRYVWEYLEAQCRIDAVVSLAQEAFQPSTHTKTSVLFATKTKERSDAPILMAVAEKVGHNKNGRLIFKLDALGIELTDQRGARIPDDDLPEISRNLKKLARGSNDISRLGFIVKRSEIKEKIYIPDFYDPLIVAEQRRLLSSGEFTMVRLGDFVESGELAISRGREIGSHFYGSGEIPFVRTSDIVNWEIKADPIKGVSEEVYSMFNRSIDVRPLDILFVNDGTFLIGRTAIVTEDNSKFLLQSHVRKLRCLGEELDPYYLMFLLNTKFVQSQIRANTFVQATISTLGNRVNDLMLPIHVDRTKRQEITKEMTEIIIGKNILAKRAKNLAGRDLL